MGRVTGSLVSSRTDFRCASTFLIVAIIALLAFLTYLPTLKQPFIEDDYPNILQARAYGPIASWPQMAADAVQRVRATQFVLTYLIERAFGLRPAAFYTVGILLHIINCCLIYALGRWKLIGYKLSFWSAVFFAIYEGHQEAVMWYSASNELLLFLFGCLSLLSWLIYLEREKPRWRWYVASLVFFVFALLSKESSVVFVPLLFLPLMNLEMKRRKVIPLIPFVLLAVAYSLSILQTASHSFRFHDESFQLSAPFWETWTVSFFALLFPWGWVSIIALLAWQQSRRLISFALVWMSLSLVPYMFVNYVHRIPSRQTYLASVGLALIVGAATLGLSEHFRRPRRWIVVAVLALVVGHNVGHIWLKKQHQFLERARPTEELVEFARNVNEQIYVRCFPRPQIIGDSAVELRLGKPFGTLIWNEADSERLRLTNTFCYEPK